MGNVAFADELTDEEIYATETDPEDDDLDEEDEEEAGIGPEDMPRPAQPNDMPRP